MSEKDRVDLFKSATFKHTTTFFDLISTSLDSADKLDDCYNVEMKINKTAQRHRMYDMHDVFTVMIIDNDGRSVLECHDLYTEYPVLTPDDVARSNKWYNQWPKEDTYRENLNLTYKFFENNCSPSLFEKVSETYDSYTEEEKGGPLFFVIMINAIMSQTEEASLSLQTRLKRLDLKDIPGENVDKAVGLLRAVIRRLKIFNRLPEDIVRTLLRIFQTSSVPAFNNVFANMEQQRLLNQVTNGLADKGLLTLDNIFKVAGSFYQLMREESQWTGESTLGTDGSIFLSRTCWNCGGTGHDVTSCTRPKNARLIEVNKKKFHEEKKRAKNANKSSGNHSNTGNGNRPPSTQAAPGTGKWRKPAPSENNRRVIDNKPMFWKQGAKRWVPDRDAANVARPPAESTATPPTAPPGTTDLPPAPAASIAMQTTNRALAVHHLRNAYSSLVNQMDSA